MIHISVESTSAPKENDHEVDHNDIGPCVSIIGPAILLGSRTLDFNKDNQPNGKLVT